MRPTHRSLLAVAAAAAMTLTACQSGTSTTPAEQAPELETGLVAQLALTPALGSAPTGAPTAGRLITPHTNVQVTDVLVADELDTSAATLLQLGSGPDAPRAAPEGFEVVVAAVSTRDLTAPFDPDPDAPPVFALTSGEERWEVEPFGSFFSTGPPTGVGYWTAPDATFVLVVPEDETLALAVTDEGRTASIDLRTGELAEDADTTAGLPYYSDRSAPLSGEGSAAGAVTDLGGAYLPIDVSVRLFFDERAFVLSPWLPARGWAAPGRIWATAAADVDATSPYVGVLEFTATADSVFELTGADGAAIPALPEPVSWSAVAELTSFSAPSMSAAWDLPAEFAGGTLTVSLDVAWTVSDLPAAFSGAPATIPAVPVTLGG
ncbi:hypothetical protein SAMN05660199_03881 [Klenkia soli]|uniref:Uncharacterized protein n=1 Tax=Klenkia soli TaxID=1052260 RepID=A0A1H0SLA9_9ACTN|nr:hypothetical protein [Klenkia soli]SDP42329.1 hypothetical protein SAMN05660199_03881 [Klenkia soli]